MVVAALQVRKPDDADESKSSKEQALDGLQEYQMDCFLCGRGVDTQVRLRLPWRLLTDCHTISACACAPAEDSAGVRQDDGGGKRSQVRVLCRVALTIPMDEIHGHAS